MIELLSQPWPWWVAGPAIGVIAAALLLIGNKSFGFSANLRHLCAACTPGRIPHFRYDWRHAGGWNLAFAVGTVIGGFIGGWVLAHPGVTIAPGVQASLTALGITDFTGLAPREIFSWSGLLTWRGFACIVGGGFCVGFGTAYAGGCTSGHGITGLASLEWRSLLAVVGFFVGGLFATYVLLPLLLR